MSEPKFPPMPVQFSSNLPGEIAKSQDKIKEVAALLHAKAEPGYAKAYRNVVEVARKLVADTTCQCHRCWTVRDMHDPSGCSYEDLEPLRQAVAELEEELAKR